MTQVTNRQLAEMFTVIIAGFPDTPNYSAETLKSFADAFEVDLNHIPDVVKELTEQFKNFTK